MPERTGTADPALPEDLSPGWRLLLLSQALSAGAAVTHVLARMAISAARRPWLSRPFDLLLRYVPLVDSYPLIMFSLLGVAFHPSWNGLMFVVLSLLLTPLLVRAMLFQASYYHVTSAYEFVTNREYRISDVSDSAVLTSDEVRADLYQGAGVEHRVRMFRVRSLRRDPLTDRTFVSHTDTTFVNYIGTSYIFLFRDPDAVRPVGRFRVLHEIGHVSAAAVFAWKREFRKVPQLLVVALIAMLSPVVNGNGLVAMLLVGWLMVSANPHGPNRFRDEQEIVADLFAVSHLPAESVTSAGTFMAEYYEKDAIAFTKALQKKDFSEAERLKEDFHFYQHPTVSLLDTLRPSFHFNRNVIWVQLYRIRQLLYRAKILQMATSVVQNTGGLGKDPDAPTRLQLGPFVGVLVIVLAALQLRSVPDRVLIAQGVLLIVVYPFMLAMRSRIDGYEREIDKAMQQRLTNPERFKPVSTPKSPAEAETTDEIPAGHRLASVAAMWATATAALTELTTRSFFKAHALAAAALFALAGAWFPTAVYVINHDHRERRVALILSSIWLAVAALVLTAWAFARFV